MPVKYPPSLGFTMAPTPLVEIKTDSSCRLWLKRDDLTGIELSGNKIRKLDFLVRQAIEEGAEGIITCGGLQSNHCRAAAFLSCKVGLHCLLYLRGVAKDIPTGNYFLNLISGAEIRFVDTDSYRQIDQLMEAEAARLQKNNQKYFVIPEGGSNELGAWGYCRCYFEIVEQMAEMKKPLDAIVVASGSGGTHAGLLIGKLIDHSRTDIISVNVCDDANYFKKKISAIVQRFASRYGYQFDLRESDVQIIDGFVGNGYAEIDEEVVAVIKRMIRDEGIILDPVYTAKAFLGLEQMLQSRGKDYKNVIFIHTGGVFGLFPYYKYFL